MNRNHFILNHDKQPKEYCVILGRRSGRTASYYYSIFRKLYAQERKKFMGEIIIIISITLILTVASSFWIGYSYGKLRTIKSYETKQVETFESYLSDIYTDYNQTHTDVSRETLERNN